MLGHTRIGAGSGAKWLEIHLLLKDKSSRRGPLHGATSTANAGSTSMMAFQISLLCGCLHLIRWSYWAPDIRFQSGNGGNIPCACRISSKAISCSKQALFISTGVSRWILKPMIDMLQPILWLMSRHMASTARERMRLRGGYLFHQRNSMMSASVTMRSRGPGALSQQGGCTTTSQCAHLPLDLSNKKR